MPPPAGRHLRDAGGPLRRAGLVAWLLVAPLWAGAPLPRVEGLRIDGTLADWGERGLPAGLFAPDAAPGPDPADSHATARLAWDTEGLLLAVAVTDTSPRDAARVSGAYLADSIELFVSLDPPRAATFQLLLSPGRAAAQPQAFTYTHPAGRPPPLEPAPGWALRYHATGYTAEARLPWAWLGRAPGAGDTVAARIVVNDLPPSGERIRFAWPATGFQPLALTTTGAADPPAPAPAALAWIGADLTTPGIRLNLRTTRELARDAARWSAHHHGQEVAVLALTPRGPVADGSVVLPPGLGRGEFILQPVTRDGPVVRLTADPEAAAAALLRRANLSWRESTAASAALAFARLEFTDHVFHGPALPSLLFRDAAAVTQLLGVPPVVRLTWLNAAGEIITASDSPGLHAARIELAAPGQPAPLVLEHVLYRLPDVIGPGSRATAHSARVLAFSLTGADATETQAARVSERWWHAARRRHGWSAPLPFALRTPRRGSTVGPAPLLVYLHGAGQHGEADAERRADELVTRFGADTFVVCARSIDPWRGPAVGELIDRLAREHPIDPRRLYLMGFSMGGIGTWEVALDQPARFAAIVPIGGRSGAPPDAARLQDLPIWAINGAEDPTTTPEEAALMVDAVNQAGGSARLTLLPGLGHGDSQGAAQDLPGLWEWLRAQSRPSPSP